MPVLLLTALLAADPAGVTVLPDVPFPTADNSVVRMDLALPPGPGPHPLLVCLHGGAWKENLGSRKDLSANARPYLDFGTGGPPLTEYLATKGYAAAAVGYRLAPTHKFPAQLHDCKAAVRFLRANAAKYRLDPDRVAVIGFSAGGHLASLVGTADPADGFDLGPCPEVSSRVRCVVDFFGPTDLSLYAQTPGLESSTMVPLLGARFAARPEVYEKASPLRYVTKDDPPFYIVHGTADIVVPILHSERLRDKLTAAGVPVEYHTVPLKGHGWSGETAAASLRDVLRFLDGHLKGAK